MARLNKQYQRNLSDQKIYIILMKANQMLIKKLSFISNNLKIL